MDWIAPTVSGFLLLATGTVAGIFGIRNTRAGAQEHRAPTATQAWEEADRARARMRKFEDLFYTALGALKHLARTVKQDHPDFILTEDVITALNLEAPEEETMKEKS